MIITRGKWLATGELWFDEPLQDRSTNIDVIRYIYSANPVGKSLYRKVYTIVNDLSGEQESISSSISKNTLYKVRRAADKDGVVHKFWSTDEELPVEKFSMFYNNFAKVKGLPNIDSAYLKSLLENKKLDMSCAYDTDNNELVWHVNYVGQTRACMLYSASLYRSNDDSGYRNMIGRANRYLHWQDMLRLKQNGMKQYDFGGWYNGDTDQDKLRINNFKQEFGGAVEERYNCLLPINIKSKLFYFFGKLFNSVEV